MKEKNRIEVGGLTLALPKNIRMVIVCFYEDLTLDGTGKPFNGRYEARYCFFRNKEKQNPDFLRNVGGLPELSLGDTSVLRFNPNSTNNSHRCPVERIFDTDGLSSWVSLRVGKMAELSTKSFSLIHFYLNGRQVECFIVWEETKDPTFVSQLYFKKLAGLAEGVFSNYRESNLYISIECSSGCNQELFDKFFKIYKFEVVSGGVVDMIITDIPDPSKFERASKVAFYGCRLYDLSPKEQSQVIELGNDTYPTQLLNAFGGLMGAKNSITD